MRRALPTGMVCAAAVQALWTAAPPQFRAGVDVVRLPVVVTDRHGLPVTGLRQADFEVRDEGVVVPINYFAAGAGDDTLPLHLGLLLDTSDSMGSDLKSAADAAVRFIDAMQEADDTTFIDFDTAVRVGRFSPQSYPMLFERIRSREARGFTALYDAIGVYVEAAMRRGGQHVLVLFTDGGDTMSRLDYGTLQMLLRAGNVVVYALGYLEHQTSAARAEQQMRLLQIAAETGGRAQFPTSRADLDRFYTKIREDVLFRYTLGYLAPAAADGPRFRQVDVRVTRPDRQDVVIRTRSGYLTSARRLSADR
jgi:Ca-activated chloride channel family protein